MEPVDLSPFVAGPTWERDSDGRLILPALTLGWEVIGWVGEYLLDPRSNVHDPKPWRFTNEQARFILWWYAIDANGRFIYRHGVLQRLKGWGKDPLLAAISLVELCGPSRFSHFDPDGSPVGKPHPAPWVQIAAVSREQTKNTMTMFAVLMSDRLKADYKIEAGIEIIRAHSGRGRLEAITSSYRSLEGARSTFVLLNEALWIDTPIPTPKGFVRMGDLEVGDTIYGKDGVPVPVTYVTEAEEGRACFKVTLPNGEFIVASEGHLWTTKLAGSAALPRVRTTLEMAEDGRRFRIPRAGMRHSENTDLPLDPYVLGAWLGDGSTGDKHVPDEYMLAGHEQRLELLRGLMDTDGHVTQSGHCVFVGNAQLSADVVELATSLGFLPSRTFAPDSRSREGGAWRVTFLLEGENPFSLPRKRDRVAVKPRRKWVTIGIEAVPSVPVRCVEVDEENHLFQAGLSFVTHNTQHWVSGNGGIKMYEALALDTPIPTPGGVTTMGALREGDTIFGSSGEQVTVTGAHEVQHGRRCYRAKLANGASVVASDGHLWLAKPKGSGSAGFKVWTTQEMVEDGRDFLVPRAPLRLSGAVDLPLDPYILGAWLGDGSSRTPDIAIGEADVTEMTAELERRGASLTRKKVREGACPMFSLTNRRRGAARESMGTPEARALRGLPCFGPGRKHIPDIYLHAGTEQRRELLRGLMDTDGCFTDGLCVFSSATERLSRNVFTLALSLGLSPHIGKYGEVWRVTFGANGFNPFSLPRKASAVRFRKSPKNIGISFEEVESVPVRCISVDAEDHLFVAGEGVVTHNTIDGNATKGGNRYLAITNAYLPGEDSVAERMRMAYTDIAEGRAPDFGTLYDTIEAHPKTGLDPDSLMEAIPLIRGDATWINPQDVIASVMKADISPARSRRMWLNQIVADEDALLTEADWAELLRPGERLEPGDQIVLGFDGGKTNDSTALVAIRVSDGLIQTLLVEEKPNDTMQRDKEAPRWEVNRDKVDSAVHAAMARYDVVAFYADVAYWESYIAQWGAQYGHKMRVKSSESNAIGWDMRGSLRRTTLAHELLLRTILDRKLCHGGEAATPLNLTLRRHMLNARRRENDYGVSFSKESRDSPKKVDAYAALMLANTALNDYRQRGKKDKPRTGRTWFM